MQRLHRLFLILCVLAAMLAPARATAYPWPVFPFEQPHPVRGNFGDPRTVYYDNLDRGALVGPGLFSFHNGVDIAADGGTPVYPVASGTARYLSATAVAVTSKHGVVFRYFHITPFAFDGQHVVASTTILGWVQPSANHVHLSEIRHGHAENPLAPTHLTPYSDDTSPTLSAIDFRRYDEPIAGDIMCGTVGITAEAYDRPELPAPGVWATMPVTPAELVWRVDRVHGAAVVTPKVSVDFRKHEPPNRLFWDTYARGSYQNLPRFGRRQYTSMPGKFVFWLDHAFDTRKLDNGVYAVAVGATDTRGNTGTATKHFTVENPCPTPPPVPSPPPPPPSPPPPPPAP